MNEIVPSSDDDKKKIDDGLLSTSEELASPIPVISPETRILDNDKDNIRIVDSEVVELRLKPPQKPPRTFDSLILGSSQSFESLSNLDANSNELSKMLTSKSDEQQNVDKVIKTKQNSYSEQTEGKIQNEEAKTGAKDIKAGYDVQKNSDPSKCKPSPISGSNEENELRATSGQSFGDHSTIINDKSASIETSNIGSSENIILGDSSTNDAKMVGNGSEKIEHCTNANMNNSDSKNIMPDNTDLEIGSGKKKKKHKKEKKEKKHKRKEKEEKKEKNRIEKEDSTNQKSSVLALTDSNPDDGGKKTKSRWKTLRSIFKVGRTVQSGLKSNTNELNDKDEEQAKADPPFSSSCSSNITRFENGSPPVITDPNICKGKTCTQCCDNVQNKSHSSRVNMTSNVAVKKVSSISNDSIHDSNLTKDEVNIDETMMASQEKTSSFDDKEWVDINDVLVRPKTVCHFLPVIHFLDTILSIVTNLIKHAHEILLID